MLCRGSELHRFKLVVKPDLSDASLHTIASELTPHNFNDVHFHSYKICEDTLFSCWSDYFSDPYQCGVYTGLTVTSARSADVISVPPALKVLLPDIGYWSRVSWCPASGRFVLLLRGRTVAVLDFLWYVYSLFVVVMVSYVGYFLWQQLYKLGLILCGGLYFQGLLIGYCNLELTRKRTRLDLFESSCKASLRYGTHLSLQVQVEWWNSERD